MPPRGVKRAREPSSTPEKRRASQRPRLSASPEKERRATQRKSAAAKTQTPTRTPRGRAAAVAVVHNDDNDEDYNEHDKNADPAQSMSLMSFLTGYADRAHSGSEGESSGSESEDDFDEDEEEDPDADANTPRSSRTGLVGLATPRRRKGTGTASAASTPRRRGTPSKPRTPRPAPTTVDEGFLKPTRADTYLLAAARAARTSGQSYGALARPLTQAEYERGTMGVRASEARVRAALAAAEGHFPQWAHELDAGFSILLYGYGSKRRLLNAFVRDMAKVGHCAVVNGHFPGLGLRDVLATLEDTLAIPDAPAPPGASPLERAAHRVYAHFSRKGARPLFLAIHNIDAPALRTPRALAALALLASSPGINVLASFDHVHAPLLFSASATDAPPHVPLEGSDDGAAAGTVFVPSSAPRGFNWVYHCCATYDDYDVELAYARLSAASLGALGQAGAAGVSEEGALQILRSVPPMAARLLKLILTRQIAALPFDTSSHAAVPPSTNSAPPFALDIELLQKTARDRFIAREEDRFNALLGEFRDHGLVVVADLAEVDGEGRQGRWGWVPLGKAAVERILDEMKDVEA